MKQPVFIWHREFPDHTHAERMKIIAEACHDWLDAWATNAVPSDTPGFILTLEPLQ